MGGDGDAGLGAGGQVGEVEVCLLLEERVVGADDGGDGFDVEEEVFVYFGDLRSSCSHVEIFGRSFSPFHHVVEANIKALAALSSHLAG